MGSDFFGDAGVDNRNPAAPMDQLTPGADDFSVNALEHAFQSARTEQVTQLDHGPDRNMQRYGQILPPRIPIENVPVPTMVYQGNLDQTSDITDTLWFIDQLDDDLYLG